MILMIDAPWPALCALLALLTSYLLTCIFVFGSFRGLPGDDVKDASVGYQLGLPNGFVILFCVTSLAALFGTYSALDPITGNKPHVSSLPKPGTVTLRFKQPDHSGSRKLEASKQLTANHLSVMKYSANVPVAEGKKPDLTIAFQAQKPILASVRSDDLVGVRTVRSHAWAVRESAELPLFLRLPSILFGILYGEDTPADSADMVVAKQESGSSARIMVSFLTTPAQSFKNHPVQRSGGSLVVRYRVTVVSVSPVVAPTEPLTVVQKTEPITNANTTVVVAQLKPEVARRDPVAVGSSKQDLQKVGSAKPTASRTPGVLLPPVLASIFYGPSNAARSIKAEQRTPRLTTLFKTAAPQAVQLVTPDPVTVVAKSFDTAPSRHPIALAALADNHRMDQAYRDGLGGPFSGVYRKLDESSEVMEPSGSRPNAPLTSGAIPTVQIDSALRSLRFAPQAVETQRQAKSERGPLENSVKSDMGATQDRAPQKKNAQTKVGRGDSQALPVSTTGRPVTIILKKEAAAPRLRKQVALVSAPNHTSAAKQNAVPAARSDRAKNLDNTRIVTAPKKPTRSPLSAEAMRQANEEINSALRGAEADLKDTDEVLEDINVIWGDYDKKKTSKRVPAKPDTKASLDPSPVAVRTLVIKPASGSDAKTNEARSTVPIRLVLKLKEPIQPSTLNNKAPPSRLDNDRELLGYITEQESINQRGTFSHCAVRGSNSKLRACRGHSVAKL
ncbi:MAG: hypothetical protein HKN05_07625 [Rhizobiales bacterium]|nr:hypothetical protein [Hyphomicrobiales bacterium]